MSKFSLDTYKRMFDALLSQELMNCSTAASEHNIMAGMKRVLGQSIKKDVIKAYGQLHIDQNLDVHFLVYDPDGEILPITLFYGD
jgi:hypothetical protein